jgi:ribosomal protein S18 acetylase RimI-like enzyme
MVEIRDAVTSDARAIGAIARESAEAHVALAPRLYRVPDMADAVLRAERMVARADSTTLVASSDGLVVGFVHVTPLPAPDPGSVVRGLVAADIGIAVSATHRGQGIGRALMEAAEDRAARGGVERLTLDALAANESAIARYRSLGYEPSGLFMHRWIET